MWTYSLSVPHVTRQSLLEEQGPSLRQSVTLVCIWFVSCNIGYYKDNNVHVFSVCTACDAANFTGRPGAEAAIECNIGMYMCGM